MVCYGPRLGTIAAAILAAYVLLHGTIGRVLHVAGQIAGTALLTCAAAAVTALVLWTVRAVQRRRGMTGGCATCRFACQQRLVARPPAAAAGSRGVPLAWPQFPRRSAEAGVVGEQRNLGPVPQAQLGQDVGDVRLDGGHAHVEPGSDLGVGVTVGDGEDDVVLARA